MKVRNVETLESDRIVRCPKGGFVSNRMVLAKDGMGYTVTLTRIPVGKAQRWHYKDHLETCFCIKGRGTVSDLATGRSYEVYPGVAYILDEHDAHVFRATEPVELVCVFNPPLEGNEVHNEDGSYSIKKGK